MWAGWLALVSLVSMPAGSLDVSAIRIADGALTETVTFRARPPDTFVRSSEAIRIRAATEGGAWRLLVHTANPSGDTGLRALADSHLGAPLLWSHADSAFVPRGAWMPLRDAGESEWPEVAATAEALVDSGAGGDSTIERSLLMAAALEGVAAGAYGTRIFLDLAFFSAPETPRSWVELVTLRNRDPHGLRIHGDAVSLVAGHYPELASVRFEFRPFGGSEWGLCETALWSDANPDSRAPHFGILWYVGRLSDGYYDVRAVATLRDGRTDPSPEILQIYKTASDSRFHGLLGRYDAQFMERRWLGAGPETVALFDGTSLGIPGAALGSDSRLRWIRVTLFAGLPDELGTPRGLRSIPRGFRRFEREDGFHHFTDSVRIEIPYSDDGLPVPAEDLGIYWFDPEARAWLPLDSRVDTERKVVVATTDHFSDFALLARAAATSVSEAIVYPNPWIPHDGRAENGAPFAAGDLSTGIIFDGLVAGSEIRIYTIAGKEVAVLNGVRFDGRIHWDVRTQAGREVASGVYIALIRGPSGETAMRKVMIVR